MKNALPRLSSNTGFNLKYLLALALPIMLQNFISSSLNLVDVLMIGQLGETTIAAVGLANQIFFLFYFMLFGITTGSGVFSAQLWGKGDVTSIRKVLGLCLLMGLTGGLFFTVVALFFPQVALGIYTQDAAVIELGSRYLRIIGWSYLSTAVTTSFSATLRSTGQVRLPMAISVFAIALKTSLNYCLIFGNLGFPQMGIEGAAIATGIARTLEMAFLVGFAYRLRTPVAGRVKEFLGFNRSFVKVFLITALPVVVNEMLWSLGITTYNAIYAHIGTESIAAINICSTVESLAFVIFIGISDATGIIIGNKIGAGDEQTAVETAKRSLIMATGLAILIGSLVFLISEPLLTMYNISAEAREIARSVLTVLSLALWVRISNMIIIVGVLRSGGDTRFGFILDAGVMWSIGVPSAFLGAFVFHLPAYWVYALVLSEEFVKYIIGLRRFNSRKWIHNLSNSVTSPAADYSS